MLRTLNDLCLNPLRRRVSERDGFPVMHGDYPIIGHFPAFAIDGLAFERRAERELGPFFWSNLGFDVWQLHCLLPESIEMFRNTVTSSSHIRENTYDLFGESVIGQDGAVHRHQRSALNSPFTPRGMAEAEVGVRFAETIEQHLQQWLARPKVRVLTATRELVLALILGMLGVPTTDLEGFRRDYEELMLLAINIPIDLPGTPRRRGLKARERLDRRIEALVREVRSRPNSRGFLADLARGRDDGGRALSDRDLFDNLRLLILAGHETTASTMAWMVATLAERRDIWDTLSAEANAADGVPRSPADLKKFPYAEAVFREVLRLYPPVSRDTRRVREDLTLGGRTVRKGTTVSVPIMHLSRSADLYERPEDLLPDRWLNKGSAPSPMELIQFGGGPHFCLGYHVAWMESVQFLVTMARMLSARGLRPTLDGPPPAIRYMPLLHPDSATEVQFLA